MGFCEYYYRSISSVDFGKSFMENGYLAITTYFNSKM